MIWVVWYLGYVIVHSPIILWSRIAVVWITYLVNVIWSMSIFTGINHSRRLDFYVAVSIDFVTTWLISHEAFLSLSHIKLHGMHPSLPIASTFTFLLVFLVQSLVNHIFIGLFLLSHLHIQIALELCHFLVKSLINSFLNYFAYDLHDFNR